MVVTFVLAQVSRARGDDNGVVAARQATRSGRLALAAAVVATIPAVLAFE